jgi:hypothetical protein
MSGDAARAKTLLATSLSLDPRDYARADNLLAIANVLSGGATKPHAVALLQIATDLHPNETKLRTRLEELQKN